MTTRMYSYWERWRLAVVLLCGSCRHKAGSPFDTAPEKAGLTRRGPIPATHAGVWKRPLSRITAGEGGGEGSTLSSTQRSSRPKSPHPNPLPRRKWRGRGELALPWQLGNLRGATGIGGLVDQGERTSALRDQEIKPLSLISRPIIRSSLVAAFFWPRIEGLAAYRTVLHALTVQSRVVLLTVLPALLAACTWAPGQAHPNANEPLRLVWPEPPDQARIELVSVISGPEDLGIERSLWTRLAGFVTGGGETRMIRPSGLAASAGRIAIADPGAAAVHLYDAVHHRALTLEACGDVVFGEPVAVAFLADHIYVSDAALARIHVFTLDGACDGGWALPQGSRPAGIAADPQRSRLYVADVGAHQVLGFDLRGNIVLRFGSQGAATGELNYPTWLALDDAGNLYVTDALNFRVQVFDPEGKPTGAFGEHGDGSGNLARPKGIGVDRGGHIYLVDALFDAVQIFDREGRYLMVFGSQGRDPGNFWLPSGLAIDGDRIYVADSYNHRVQVFRFLGGEP